MSTAPSETPPINTHVLSFNEADPTRDLLDRMKLEPEPIREFEDQVASMKKIEAGVFAQAVLDGEAPLPAALAVGQTEASFRAELAVVAEEGRIEKSTFIRANLGLILLHAGPYKSIAEGGKRGHDLSFQDLVSLGTIGLMEAVAHFDYTKGFKFSTFAGWWIRKELSKGIREEGRTIRLTPGATAEVTNLRRMRGELIKQLDREPTTEELAQALDTTPERVVKVIHWGNPPKSLNTPVGDHEAETELIDVLDIQGARTDAGFDHAILGADMVRLCKEAMQEGLVTDEDLQVFCYYHGVLDGDDHTYTETGKYFGLSRSQVSNLVQKTRTTLQRYFKNQRQLREQRLTD